MIKNLLKVASEGKQNIL